MRVGSSYAERTDSGAARMPVVPFGQLGVDAKRTVGEINLEDWAVRSASWAESAGAKRQNRLDETGHARGRIQVADVCL